MKELLALFETWHARYVTAAETISHGFIFIVRTYWGYQFLQTGWGKLHHLEGVAAFFASLGVPFPYANAMLVGGLETLGGLFLILGLASRYITIPLIVVLSVAYATDDREALLNIWNDPDKFTSATPFLFLLSSLLVFAFGAGRLSLDQFIGRWWQKRITAHPVGREGLDLSR